MRRVEQKLVVGALVVWYADGAAHGAFETLVEVVQPMTTTEGIQIGTVTYSEYFTQQPLGLCVTLFSRDSRIMDQLGKPVSRNLAYLTGVRAWPESHLLGDTLRVYLDLRDFKVDKAAVCCTEGEIVQAIFDCLLVNAYNSRRELDMTLGEWRSAEFIDVRVLGDQFRGLQGVRACRDIAKLPHARQ